MLGKCPHEQPPDFEPLCLWIAHTVERCPESFLRVYDFERNVGKMLKHSSEIADVVGTQKAVVDKSARTLQTCDKAPRAPSNRRHRHRAHDFIDAVQLFCQLGFDLTELGPQVPVGR